MKILQCGLLHFLKARALRYLQRQYQADLQETMVQYSMWRLRLATRYRQILSVGIGILPNVELAKNSGLSTDNGIVVNEYLETSVSGIYAAGDVARFYSPVFGRHLRLEHYDLTIKHGKIAGENMSGSVKPFDDLPYFFSFIFELRIEVYGDMSKYDKIVVRGRTDGKEGFVKFYADGGVVNAVMLVNKKEDVAVIKDLILSRKKFDDLSILGNESIKLNELVLVKKS